MSQHKRNDELTDATIQPYPPKEPNAESIEAIHEGNAFFASGEPGRFGKVDFQSQRNSLNGSRVSAASATRE